MITIEQFYKKYNLCIPSTPCINSPTSLRQQFMADLVNLCDSYIAAGMEKQREQDQKIQLEQLSSSIEGDLHWKI